MRAAMVDSESHPSSTSSGEGPLGAGADPSPNNNGSSKVVRRRRNAISCLECRARKIKCDRNVPGCSSCVARGIKHRCKWGDERDELENSGEQQQQQQQQQQKYGSGSRVGAGGAAAAAAAAASARKRMRADGREDEGEIDRIVFAVLKRLRGQSSTSSPDAESSVALAAEMVRDEKKREEEEEMVRNEREDKTWVSEAWTYGMVHPQTGTNARSESVSKAIERPNLVSAFDGSDVHHVPKEFTTNKTSATFAAIPAGIQLAITEEDFAELVDVLPMLRAPLDGVIDFFLEHLEPSMGAFNRVVLRNHVDLFWAGVTAVRSSMMMSTPSSTTKKRSSSSSSSSAARHGSMSNSYGSSSALASAASASAATTASKAGILGSMGGITATPSSEGSPSSPENSGAAALATAGFDSPTRLGLVALILVLTAVSCDKMPGSEVIGRRVFPSTYDESQIPKRKEAMWALAMRFLAQSNYLQQPTLWTLQTIACAKLYWFDRKMMSTCTIWNTTAIRIAQSMGLHRLGSAVNDVRNMRRTGHASCTEEEEERSNGSAINMEFDPLSGHSWARKWHKASVSLFERDSLSMRELGRKIWYHLTIHDWIFASHMDHAYSIRTEKTSLPLCLDDEDVVYRLHTMEEKDIERRESLSYPSDNSYILSYYQVARIIRQLIDLEEELEADFGFKETCIISDQLRDFLSGLPAYYRFDGVSELSEEVRRQHAARPYLSLQRVLLHEQVHTRLMRLHRNHIGRGLRDEAYVDSVSCCAEAASVVVTVRDELERVQSPLRNMGFFKAHVFQAVLVIQIILMWATSIRPYDSATDDHQKRLWLSLNLSRLASDMDRCVVYLRNEAMVESPMRIIEALAKKLRLQLESSIDNGTSAQQAKSSLSSTRQQSIATASPADSAGMYQAHWLSAQPSQTSSTGLQPVDESEAALDRFLAGFIGPASQQHQQQQQQHAAPARFEQPNYSAVPHQQQSSFPHQPSSHDIFTAPTNLPDTSFLDTMFPQYAENGTDLLGALESALYAFQDGSAAMPLQSSDRLPTQAKEIPLLP